MAPPGLLNVYKDPKLPPPSTLRWLCRLCRLCRLVDWLVGWLVGCVLVGCVLFVCLFVRLFVCSFVHLFVSFVRSFVCLVGGVASFWFVLGLCGFGCGCCLGLVLGVGLS